MRSDSVPSGGQGAYPRVQIDVIWTASTDNVGVTEYRIERCTGSTCTTFSQVGTSTINYYADTTITGTSQNYKYRVRAADAAGNLSAYSSIIYFAYVGYSTDTTTPSVPGGLAASVVSQSQIDLSWSTATDNVGVTGYLLERCSGISCSSFVQIRVQTATTFSDTGLAAGTVYSYRVRARDAVANTSAYGATATATTSSSSDATPPSATTVLALRSLCYSDQPCGRLPVTTLCHRYRIERCLGAAARTLAKSQHRVASYRTRVCPPRLCIDINARCGRRGNLGAYSGMHRRRRWQAVEMSRRLLLRVGWRFSTDQHASESELDSFDGQCGVTGYRVERCQGRAARPLRKLQPVWSELRGHRLSATQVPVSGARGRCCSERQWLLGTFSISTLLPLTLKRRALLAIFKLPPGTTTMSLTWSASSDNVAVTGISSEMSGGRMLDILTSGDSVMPRTAADCWQV